MKDLNLDRAKKDVLALANAAKKSNKKKRQPTTDPSLPRRESLRFKGQQYEKPVSYKESDDDNHPGDDESVEDKNPTATGKCHDENYESDEDNDLEKEAIVSALGGGTVGKGGKRKKGAEKKVAKRKYTDWGHPDNYRRLKNKESELEKLLIEEKDLKQRKKTTLKVVLARAKIPGRTWDNFKANPDKFRKNASLTAAERRDKKTQHKKASGSLSKHPNTVRSRDRAKKIVEGHVPTRGPRKMKAEGDYSNNDAAQRSRDQRRKRLANNAVAATVMVIDESGDL